MDAAERRTELSNVRSHLANERTQLSFLRTGISLISFGVTLNRFSLFLIQNENMTTHAGVPFLRDTENVGIGMVILGSLLLIWSVQHFLKTAKEIDSSSFKPSKWSLLIFTLAVVVLGTLMTFWLI